MSAPPLDKDSRRDAKAGYCSFCRQGSHALCASSSCRCPQPRRHPRRPTATADRPGAPTNGLAVHTHVHVPPAPPPKKPAKGRPDPDFTLVKADPPAPPRPSYRKTLVEKIRPSLEQIMAEGSHDWYRVALYEGRGAGVAKGRLAKAYRTEWEWRSVWLPETGQSAVYVRWLGTEPAALS